MNNRLSTALSSSLTCAAYSLKRAFALVLLFLISHLFLNINLSAVAAPLGDAAAESVQQLSAKNKWAKYYPYAPEKKEFHIEMGGMWEKQNMYWLGGLLGFHTGRCSLINDVSCQQYFDVIGGVGSRDELTEGTVLASLRWQYLSFPKPFSPSARLFVGGQNIRDNDRDRFVGTSGFGIGWSAALHPKLDFNVEYRAGYGDAYWSQATISFSFKVDKFIDDVSKDMMEIGEATVRSTGKLIEATVTAPKTFYEWFNKSSSPKPEKK